MALALAMTRSCICSPLKKYHVRIINNLEDTYDLYLYCKSGDDDLGFHELKINDQYHFTFRENLWGTTLYWCNFG
ncbi:conserved hypothetical protein [Ricinus communis]|uniref:S-protein homolog n=1 Tax=Ricinus communis TaxID=3988 RepID=B9RTI1_RICCO|nr:conserved hypothetical protein [Ricinus communis]